MKIQEDGKDQGQFITIRGARQNNLKGVDLRLPLYKLIVVTGVSGSGKSSLAFDTIYSEGQRRYVETFSAYTRQFLDRMDRPKVDFIEGIPPAIAIDQTNPVRTSRSTVGTMTELNDHIKLLFARAARLYCSSCGKPVQRDTPDSIWDKLIALSGQKQSVKNVSGEKISEKNNSGFGVTITFPVPIPRGFSEEEVIELLGLQGYRRIYKKEDNVLIVTQDRLKLSEKNRVRAVEDLEAAFKYGRGRVNVYTSPDGSGKCEVFYFSSDLHCPDCDIHYTDPVGNLFSFNSPIGACPTCRGFGRTIGIDYNLVVPDDSKTLSAGAVKPWQTKSYYECHSDMMRFALRRGIPVDLPWKDLSEKQKSWVLEGEGEWEDGKWYGVKRFFDWLETKSYRMHIRVLLSKYRMYQMCHDCKGARLKPEALLWRIGDEPGYTVHDVMLMPIIRCYEFFNNLKLPGILDEAAGLLLSEIRSRLKYLVEVGLGYLTLDRQSRTLSGGEVQRINLTTALGTSLVDTLFVLDEPSIGLHPRDIHRLIKVLYRLRDAGNTLIVVEHDPDVIRAADLVIDMGPGPGERGGDVVFFGRLEEMLFPEQSKIENQSAARASTARSTAVRDLISRSLTAAYLTGKKSVLPPERSPDKPKTGDIKYVRSGATSYRKEEQVVGSVQPDIRIIGASEHNLKNIDVSLPLGRLVCITGVSGSGKSTLVQDVLYNALRKIKKRPVDIPGSHRAILGHDLIDDVVLVDQSPIGKTTRSNPASYVGALDRIRKLFSDEPLSKERGYTPGTFSFNSVKGRCPSCGGSGFEHIEMQFLSDVYLRCPDCDGRRYKKEVLDVKLLPVDGSGSSKAKSIAGVLEMTVNEACAFFSEAPDVLRALEPLRAVGLDYVSLGQPVPTLSGGEAQRLKLAGHLAGGTRRKRGHRLFLLDEPTTGLHFDDIATLLRALRRLLESGHSVVVIEHNMDVIRSADWIIDLGPEGGDDGGNIVCTGKPWDVAKCRESYTGKALKKLMSRTIKKTTEKKSKGAVTISKGERVRDEFLDKSRSRNGVRYPITVRKAREHNLRNIDVRIPRFVFTVITGVSGSGKSTLAFDILFSEGQRRYLESLNAYARQFVQPSSRPDVDGVSGVPPTVAIEQRVSRGGRKSTVATMTEIYHFLRLIFVKLGTQYCPDCGVPIQPQPRNVIVEKMMKEYKGQRLRLLAPLVINRKGYYTDLAKWASQKGCSHLRVDGVMTPVDDWPRLNRFKEHSIEYPLYDDVIAVEGRAMFEEKLDLALEIGKGVVYISSEKGREVKGRGRWEDETFSTKRACPLCGRGFEELDPRLFSFNSKHGWCTRCFGTGLVLPGFDNKQTGEEKMWSRQPGSNEEICPECGGLRLRPEALAVRFRDKNIADFTKLTVEQAFGFFKDLKYSGHEKEIAVDIVSELTGKLSFLVQVGLPYLSLDRSAPTLSSGESQRLRLASQLGSNLRGVCYILDEPTIGLHTRDNRMLLDTLQRLKSKGNTVVVVEHDEETIRRAEHVLDLGPGGGTNGGKLVASGTVEEILKKRGSVTGKFLQKPLLHPVAIKRSGEWAKEDKYEKLEIENAGLHNLKNLHVEIPLGKLISITGVSGSGKSTLVMEVLFKNMRRILLNRRQLEKGTGEVVLEGCGKIRGWGTVTKVLEVDQTPIGKTPRSCPATYVGFWDEIRRLYASTTEARMRGYEAGRFSFNVARGRCEGCAGQGLKKIKMSFLPDVSVVCEVCSGKRFTPETLEVLYKDKSIYDVLAMSVDEAAEFFAHHPRIHHPIRLLQSIGLGYITLGQQSPTLSGGEAQRIRLVTELAKTKGGFSDLFDGEASDGSIGNAKAQRAAHSLYVLDEPTIGLHMADVEKLIRVLRHLVDAGNTVIIIEHNMDVIAEADWIIDLGPEGGERGGEIVAQGDPQTVSAVRKKSHTAKVLAKFLKERSRVV
jgi:excinuclease ABC subunit A